MLQNLLSFQPVCTVCASARNDIPIYLINIESDSTLNAAYLQPDPAESAKEVLCNRFHFADPREKRTPTEINPAGIPR